MCGATPTAARHTSLFQLAPNRVDRPGPAKAHESPASATPFRCPAPAPSAADRSAFCSARRPAPHGVLLHTASCSTRRPGERSPRGGRCRSRWARLDDLGHSCFTSLRRAHWMTPAPIGHRAPGTGHPSDTGHPSNAVEWLRGQLRHDPFGPGRGALPVGARHLRSLLFQLTPNCARPNRAATSCTETSCTDEHARQRRTRAARPHPIRRELKHAPDQRAALPRSLLDDGPPRRTNAPSVGSANASSGSCDPAERRRCRGRPS